MTETESVDTEEAVSKTFELSPTKASVDIVDKAKGTHPVFFVSLFPGDTRLIDNIQMAVIGPTETKSIQLEFKQVSPNGSHGFGIESVRLDGGRILIGDDVAIALSRIAHSGGGGVFYVSAPRGLNVRHKRRIPRS